VTDDKISKQELLAIVKPGKKIGDMTDDELLAFARQIVSAAKGKMPRSPANESE
jgi:hypothetical protein